MKYDYNTVEDMVEKLERAYVINPTSFTDTEKIMLEIIRDVREVLAFGARQYGNLVGGAVTLEKLWRNQCNTITEMQESHDARLDKIKQLEEALRNKATLIKGLKAAIHNLCGARALRGVMTELNTIQTLCNDSGELQ